jgi:post-segregation antitoxin (ccd killing protein)
MLFLCSCATQRNAEKYFDANTAKLAKYIDEHEVYTQEFGSAYAAKHFPPKYYPPAVYTKSFISPSRLSVKYSIENTYNNLFSDGIQRRIIDKPTTQTKTVYIQDTAKLEAQAIDLKLERRVNKALRKQLKSTEAERDYWQEKNRKKFWALMAMAVFGSLYIIFKVLADRVRVA